MIMLLTFLYSSLFIVILPELSQDLSSSLFSTYLMLLKLERLFLRVIVTLM